MLEQTLQLGKILLNPFKKNLGDALETAFQIKVEDLDRIRRNYRCDQFKSLVPEQWQ